MISFSKFIIESGDSHYPYKKSHTYGNFIHHYDFDDGSGKKKRVTIDHDGSAAEIAFHDTDKEEKGSKEKYGATGESKGKSLKVFSTVKHILKKHASEHPDLHVYSFSSNKHEPSRVSLYKRMASKLGGASEEGKHHYHHMIPVNKL